MLKTFLRERAASLYSVHIHHRKIIKVYAFQKYKKFTLLQRIEVVLFNFNILKVFISMGIRGASYIRLFRKLSYPNVHLL